MASLKKPTELSPLFLCTGGGSVAVGEGCWKSLFTVSSRLAGLWETDNSPRKNTRRWFNFSY